MTDYSSKEHALSVVEALKALYPDAECALTYEGEPWKLLVMARLSAQCTDKRVNIVCRDLFRKYPTAKDLGQAGIEDVEAIVKPCGLYHVKASDIVSECRMLTEEYGGILPDTMEELLKFDGVGRKVANLLLGDIYKKPAVVVDTHCIRLSNRLGLVPEGLKDPPKIEKILSSLLPEEEQSDFCHRLVDHGRAVCTAKSPDCENCSLSPLCRYSDGKQKPEG